MRPIPFRDEHPAKVRHRPFRLARWTALALSLAFPALSSAVTCNSPSVATFTAGMADAFTLPTEPASPSAELLAFLATSPPLAFDEQSINRHFGHTFTGLPPGIIGAKLTLRVRALSSASNDGMALELMSGPSFAWSRTFAALSGLTWNSPDEALLTLDLANLPPSGTGVTDILAALADGDLDVYMQDDTSPDFLSLEVTFCPAAACVTPPWGLAGWWPLDETAGPVAADVVGHNDGTYVSAPVPVPGQVGGALSFDGVNDYVTVPDASVLDIGTQDLTLDAWVFTEVDTGIRTIVDKMDLASGAGYSLSLVAGNVLTFAWGDASGFTFIHSSSATPVGDPEVPTGEWAHVAVTLDRNDPAGGRFYINGALVNTFNGILKPGSFASSAPLRIGLGGIFNNGFFNGAIDELEVFNRALDPSEVKDLYAAGPGGKCKASIHVDWDVPFCLQDLSATTVAEVCNNSGSQQSFSLTFAGLPKAVLGCQVDGPTGFTLVPPAASPLLVPPFSCRSVGVNIARPVFTQNGDQSCYRVTAVNAETGQSVFANGSVWDQRNLCPVCDLPNPFDLPFGETVPVVFDVTNTTLAPITLLYEFDAMAADMNPANETVSLNSLPPGTNVQGQILIPAGQTREVSVDAGMVQFDPLGYQDLLLIDRGNGSVLRSTSLRSVDTGCTPSPTALCLNNGRFRVVAAWKDFQGNTGVGQAVALTGDTGYFWFFGQENVELILKVLDGRTLNDRFWVFYGALSTVEYVITVTDTQTGAEKTYFNASGNLASVADTSALPGSAAARSLAAMEESAGLEGFGLEVDRSAFEEDGWASLAAAAACAPTATSLCLNGSRFRVEVAWKDFQGNQGVGKAVALTSDTGYFWFFASTNVELVLKVLDGRSLNGHWWVFYGALSSVEYRITVTDTLTGNVKVYTNPSGNLGSRADTTALLE